MLLKKDVYNAKIKEIEDKIPNITNLATNITLNSKINEVKNEMPSITNLVTNASLNSEINEVKNEIPSITNLDTTTVLTNVEKKFNKLAAEDFTARLIQEKLATKGWYCWFRKKDRFW